MKYYKEKRLMFLKLEELIRMNSYDVITIIYLLSLKYEVSEKSIRERIMMLEELGKIEQKEGIITWL